MLKVIGKKHCRSVEVESDPYVPLTVTWDREGGQQPLYWRVTGERGGEVEVKLDPLDGAPFEVVVIESPPPVGDISSFLERPDEIGLPIFDCSPWGIIDNPDYREYASRVISSVEPMEFFAGAEGAILAFSDDEVSHSWTCGSVSVHVAAGGALVAISILARDVFVSPA